MPGQVPVLRTPVGMHDYANAVVRGWEPSFGVLSPAAAATLWAQYFIETGARDCWNFNIGNVKHVEGDGHDWVALSNVFEYIQGRRVVLHETDPGARFRAYPSLAAAMREQMHFLQNERYHFAWPHVLSGDFSAFATSLHEHGYFTATAAAYAAGMRGPYEAFLASPHYFAAVEALAFEACEEVPDTERPKP